MFGAVNAIFSGFAFAGIIISLYLQRIDLKNQHQQLELNREEIKNTNKEFKIQNDTLRIQQFENQYYKMIDLHRANITDVKVPYLEVLESSSRSSAKSTITSNTQRRELTGKKVFVDMAKELEICLKYSLVILKSKNQKYKDSDIFHFAYKIFFWGINSEFINSELISILDQKKVIELLRRKQNDYKKDSSKPHEKGLKIRYIPFQGHESKLAHYYRHLFHTVRYVVDIEKSGLIDYYQARQYLRILRSQLSNAEQLMLYYNYICSFGCEWDKNGKRGNMYFTDYRMIHNIPVGRVKFVDSPRKHFLKFIEWCCSENDPLFEWGDY